MSSMKLINGGSGIKLSWVDFWGGSRGGPGALERSKNRSGARSATSICRSADVIYDSVNFGIVHIHKYPHKNTPVCEYSHIQKHTNNQTQIHTHTHTHTNK